MSKKFLLVIFSLIFLFNSHKVFASVVINEVQLLPTGERFVELYNQDKIEVDLTDYYIQRKIQTGSSFTSLVSKTNFVNKKISANGYFVISRSAFSNSDIVLSTLTLTESNTIQIKNGAGEVINSFCFGDVVSCSSSVSNPPEGQSIGRDQNGLLIIGNRSPGVANQTSSQSDTPSTDTENSNPTDATDSVVSTADANAGVTSSSSGAAKDVLATTSKSEDLSIKTKVKTKSVSFLDTPLTFEVKSYGIHGEELSGGKYFWNFGDGTTEEKMDSKNLTHTYSYPGEYLVSVEYFANTYSSIPDVLNKIKIKVVPIELSISRMGDEKDFFVEIFNNSNYDIDLSLWKLSSLNKVFIFPRNTNILAKKKIILSSTVTKFVIDDKNNLKLFTSNDKIVYQAIPEVKIVEEELGIEEGQSSIGRAVLPVSVMEQVPEIVTEKIDFNGVISSDEKISASDLSATAINSDILPENLTNSFIFPIILFIFLFVSGGAVYFIRRNSVISQAQNDFEILDE